MAMLVAVIQILAVLLILVLEIYENIIVEFLDDAYIGVIFVKRKNAYR